MGIESLTLTFWKLGNFFPFLSWSKFLFLLKRFLKVDFWLFCLNSISHDLEFSQEYDIPKRAMYSLIFQGSTYNYCRWNSFHFFRLNYPPVLMNQIWSISWGAIFWVSINWISILTVKKISKIFRNTHDINQCINIGKLLRQLLTEFSWCFQMDVRN